MEIRIAKDALEMNEMTIIFEILKYILPSVVVFGTAYYILNLMLQKEERREKLEILLKNQKLITPIRLQAYERVVLFLERISPELLITRTNTPNMTSKQLQMAMLHTIRNEFQHNLSQQIYISTEAWEAVVNAKESIVQLINVAGNNAKKDASAVELSKTILNMVMKVDESPIRKSINFIKEESGNFLDIKREYAPN